MIWCVCVRVGMERKQYACKIGRERFGRTRKHCRWGAASRRSSDRSAAAAAVTPTTVLPFGRSSKLGAFHHAARQRMQRRRRARRVSCVMPCTHAYTAPGGPGAAAQQVARERHTPAGNGAAASSQRVVGSWRSHPNRAPPFGRRHCSFTASIHTTLPQALPLTRPRPDCGFRLVRAIPTGAAR